jgi:hypothetical protein
VIDGVSLTHDEATKAVKQMLKNSARLKKGAEELRELKTSAALCPREGRPSRESPGPAARAALS